MPITVIFTTVHASFPYRFHPLGDAAVLVSFGNTMDEQLNAYIIERWRQLQANQPSFITDMLPAYSSLSIFYDTSMVARLKPAYRTAYDFVCCYLEKQFLQELVFTNDDESDLIRIPVCYEDELAPDVEALAKIKQLSVSDIIRLHLSVIYRVYMIGFLPGFAYMGPVDTAIAMPRKNSPQQVKAGSVGIAGAQTGIYPLDSPGGWHIIGRTPIKLFDTASDNPVLLKAGNKVQFYSISYDEYTHYQSRNI